MKRFVLASCVGILTLASANAQEFSKFTFDFGGGYTVPAGSAGSYLGWGWNIEGGAGLNFSPYIGAKLNLGYDSMGVNSASVAAIGIPGGQVNIFHATIDPVIHLTPKSHADFYLTGGGGLFNVNRNFNGYYGVTTNAVIPGLGFISSPNGPSPVPGSWSINKLGFDVGGGVAIGAFGHGKIFAEAHWDHPFMNSGHFDFIPVSFGFRW